MEIPAKVAVFNQAADIKGKAGTLVAINQQGFYEVSLEFKDRVHTVLFPIADTVIIFNDPLPQIPTDFEIER
ncbi:MAG TPA: hypothetical protein VMT00_17230 [Thermoanaerobaculia bacterium]|nr:hypothetical protein [Thermoanaerobaculia bacterium]